MRKIAVLLLVALVLPACPAPDLEKAKAEEAVAAAEQALVEAKKAIKDAPPQDLVLFFGEFRRVRLEKETNSLWSMMAPAAQRDFDAAAARLKQQAAAVLQDNADNAKKLVPGVLLPAGDVVQMEAGDLYAALTARQLTDEVVAAYRDAKLISAVKAADGKSATIRFSLGDGSEFQLALVPNAVGSWLVLKKSPVAKRPASTPAPAPASPAPAPAASPAPAE